MTLYCPLCKEQLIESIHTEYNGDDDYGTDSKEYECPNECSFWQDTPYGDYLEPLETIEETIQ